MNSDVSRRRMMQAAGVAGWAPSAMAGAAARWPLVEGPGTPKICLGGARDEAAMRRIKQLGVDYVLGGGGKIPWQEADLRSQLERATAAGLTVCNMMPCGTRASVSGTDSSPAEACCPWAPGPASTVRSIATSSDPALSRISNPRCAPAHCMATMISFSTRRSHTISVAIASTALSTAARSREDETGNVEMVVGPAASDCDKGR